MSEPGDWAITQFELLGEFVIRIRFKDGTEQTIDFEPVIGRGWMAQLSDPAYFRRVKLEGGNLEWPDGQDFSPEALHDWPAYEQAYIEDAESQD